VHAEGQNGKLGPMENVGDWLQVNARRDQIISLPAGMFE